ncbi:MAG: DUF2080 family transposase-associated protein [Nanoarchaeota archaeon]|nr:DUF2080 family transposase-associated protein [Nanoarchaeota archaeon]
MRKIKITNKQIILKDDIEEIAEGQVKKIGNGAMILSSKKHLGKNVYILIRKN